MLNKSTLPFIPVLLTLLYSIPGYAQMRDMMSGNCPMCDSMGGFGMVLMGVIMIAGVVGLIALAVFLIKRISASPK